MKPASNDLIPDSFILRAVVKAVFVILNVFAVYMMLKGHNQPGGGFIGGLVAALALVLVNMVLGREKFLSLIRVDPLLLAASGLMIAYLVSLAPVFFGKEFLKHHLLNLGNFQLHTAVIFDLGVFLVVVGVTSKLISVFSSSVQLGNAFVKAEEKNCCSPEEEPIETRAHAEPSPLKSTRGKKHRRR
jgi:multicomponent Na+:H+ antiporter subunit B